MQSVLASLQPPPRQRHADDVNDHDLSGDAAEWGSMGGFGNLNKVGGVQGMMVPRVPDVSGLLRCSGRLVCQGYGDIEGSGGIGDRGVL